MCFDGALWRRVSSSFAFIATTLVCGFVSGQPAKKQNQQEAENRAQQQAQQQAQQAQQQAQQAKQAQQQAPKETRPKEVIVNVFQPAPSDVRKPLIRVKVFIDVKSYRRQSHHLYNQL